MQTTRIDDGAAVRPAPPPVLPSPKPAGQPLLALQAMRFAAAAMVLIHHAGYDADTIGARTGQAPLALDRVFDWGFGIHLFFVLSGFIMVYAERDFGAPGAPRRFIVRRLIRIVPLYWLLTTLLLIGAWVAPALLNNPVAGWAQVLGSYLFIPVVASAEGIRPILGQGWTLNYEMLFYVGFALAMVTTRPLGLAALTACFVALVLAGALFPPKLAPLQVWTDPLLLEFLFGVGVGLVHQSGLRLPLRMAVALVAVGAVLAVAFGPILGLSARVPVWLGQGGPAALILSGLALGPPWRATPLARMGGALGDASYSLYLSHPFAIRPLRNLWLKLGFGLPLALYLLAACVVAIVVSLVLFHGVERPVTRFLRRRFDVRRDARPGGVVPRVAMDRHAPGRPRPG